MHDLISDFFARLVYIDVAVFFSFGVVHSLSWLGPVKQVNNDAIAAAAQAGNAALGILLAASFVVVQLTRSSENPLPASVAADVFFATLWFLAALVFGFLVIWRLAMYGKAHRGKVLDVGILFGLELIAALIGVGRLIVSIAEMIY